jgi:hypothetical protein
MTLLRVAGPVDECGVCFAVYGEELDPNTVTALLGHDPTSIVEARAVARGAHRLSTEVGSLRFETGHRDNKSRS